MSEICVADVVAMVSLEKLQGRKDYSEDGDKLLEGNLTVSKEKKPVFCLLFPEQLVYFSDQSVSNFQNNSTCSILIPRKKRARIVRSDLTKLLSTQR